MNNNDCRISLEQKINTAMGETTIIRTGTLTGEESEVGMLRVVWDEDGLGRNGWVAPRTFSTL